MPAATPLGQLRRAGRYSLSAAEGWQVIPITYRQITQDPDHIARILARVLTPSRLRAAAA